MFSNNMYKTVWDAMQTGGITVRMCINRFGEPTQHSFYTGQHQAMNADVVGTDNITFMTVSGFYKHGDIVLVEVDDEVYVYGRYGRLAILPNHPDFEYARALAEINREEYSKYKDRGFDLDNGWKAIHEKYGL